MAGLDYEHWADEPSSPKSSKSSVVASVAPSTIFSSYDSNNGLHKFTYTPTNQDKKEEDKPEKSATQVCAPPPSPPSPPPAAQPQPQPQPQAQQQVYYMMGGHLPMQYAPFPQQMAYPAPAYYGYPGAGMPYGGMPVVYPAPAEQKKEEKKEEKKKKDRPEVKKWQGRTKTEVEEDNMKIAMRDGVCDARKVEPKGLKEDQMVWCVETDGSHTLRTYASVKEFEGEWKADPRFKDSWYFVRGEEKGK